MATYQFRCEDCTDEKEIVRSMKDDSLVPCLACMNPSMTQVLFAPRIAFKGAFSLASVTKETVKFTSEIEEKNAERAKINASKINSTDTRINLPGDEKLYDKRTGKKHDPK